MIKAILDSQKSVIHKMQAHSENLHLAYMHCVGNMLKNDHRLKEALDFDKRLRRARAYDKMKIKRATRRY